MCTILGGWLLFQQVYPPKAIAGALVAVVAMVMYTKFNLDEGKQRTKGSEMSDGSNAAAPKDDQELGAGDQMPLKGDPDSEGLPLMSRRK